MAAAKADLEGALTAVRDGEARSAAAAKSDLAIDQADLTELTAEQKRLQAAFDATNKENGGILIRLQALNRLSDRNLTLGLAHRMLSLLFICIELLPMLMKVLLNFGPPSVYDRLSEMRDSSDIEVAELQRQARRTVEREQAELLVLAERDRVERQKEALLARRRLADARQAARAEPDQQAVREFEEAARRTWDTGPILGLARTAAARTVRSMTRRTAERVPSAV